MKAYRIVTRQADTMVRLRSGEELVIGGLIDRQESYTFRKVPILGTSPFWASSFRAKAGPWTNRKSSLSSEQN